MTGPVFIFKMLFKYSKKSTQMHRDIVFAKVKTSHGIFYILYFFLQHLSKFKEDVFFSERHGWPSTPEAVAGRDTGKSSQGFNVDCYSMKISLRLNKPFEMDKVCTPAIFLTSFSCKLWRTGDRVLGVQQFRTLRERSREIILLIQKRTCQSTWFDSFYRWENWATKGKTPTDVGLDEK